MMNPLATMIHLQIQQRRALLGSVFAVLVWSAVSGWAWGQSAGTFRDFAGTCQGSPEVPHLYDLVGWDRSDISWSQVEPRQGEWKQEELEKWGKRILEMRAKGVTLLPILCYGTDWSWDRAERTYDLGDQRVHVKPLAGGEYLVETFRLANGVWAIADSKNEKAGDHWPLAREHQADWENYVRRTVSFFRQAPYKVEYFQIWNEAYPTSDFWGHGDLDTYMKRVHVPASKIIRELGGKVVYGGWPCCGKIEDYVAMLDRNHAWDTVDVLDIHYFPLSAFQYLNQEAKKRGHDSLGLWQTELGFSTDPEFIGNTYPRFLSWCLAHDWSYPDRYRLFLFCGSSPDDPKAFGYARALVSGSKLSPHGLSLQTLGEEFSTNKIELYDGVKTRPPLKSELSEVKSSVESFNVGDKKLVIAIHLVEGNDAKIFTDWNGNLGSVHLDFGNPMIEVSLPQLKPNEVVAATRVDLAGQRQAMEVKMAKSGEALIEVPIRDQENSPARQWFSKSSVLTFLVEVTLRPATP
ncbi:MAG: hypothetical protein ABSH48_14190 [Verrucomicrobiota bacterium]|jgi:hypothetical protein